jgi:hypothetical protein
MQNAPQLRSFGAAPGTFQVIPTSCVMASSMPAATIRVHIPFANIQPFGMFHSLTNPTVVSATSAVMGALTPIPCGRQHSRLGSLARRQR